MARFSRRRFLQQAGLGAVAAAAAPAPALARRRAAVRGKVRDGVGRPILGARVILFAADGDGFWEARTDARGKYAIAGVPPGPYRMGASAPGLEYLEESVAVGSGTLKRRFLLDPERHEGEWRVIGDTEPERFGGTNSGVLMPDGRVILCHDTQDPVVFDPISGQKSFPVQPREIRNSTSSEQGCHHVSYLLDGRVLYVGGGTLDANGDFGSGESAIDVVKAFDPATETWEVLPPLGEPRWYPGLVRLPDGDLLAFGGGQRPARERSTSCEILDHVTREWRPTGDLTKLGGFGPAATLYSGEVFLTWYPPQIYDPSAGTWRDTSNFRQPARGGGGATGSGQEPVPTDHPDHSVVVLRDGRVAAIGVRGAAGGRMLEIFDPSDERWSFGANPATLRGNVEVVQLPDGRVLVTGGAPHAGETVFVNAWGYTNATDLYDPDTDSWRAVAPMKNAREYHATTLLLPDGRVLVAAGTSAPGLNAPPTASKEIEAYSPPYLFRGPRPRIHSVSSADLAPGATVSLEVSRAPRVTSVRLAGVSAATHFLDGGTMRLLDLEFTQSGSAITARVPEDAAVAMAGYYLLFVLVDDVPSVGRIVRITHEGLSRWDEQRERM